MTVLPTTSASSVRALLIAMSMLVAAQASAESVRGFTRCAADLQLSFPLAGRIAATRVEEGHVVKPGKLLMQLESKAEELDVERRLVQWQGKADLLVAQARKETAEKQWQAAKAIYAENRGISLEELQNRDLALRTTLAELERVTTQKKVEHLDYLVANENLQRRKLTSPTPGIVTHLIKQPGESVQAYEAVLRMCDLSHIEFMANVPALQSETLKVGGVVDIVVGESAQRVKAKVVFVSPIVDPASGLRELKAELMSPPASVRPGQIASLQWQ